MQASDGDIMQDPSLVFLIPLATSLISQCSCRVSTRPDVRAAWLARLVTLPVNRVLPLLYPRLLPLHRVLADPAGFGNEGGGPQGRGPLPPALGGLTAERLETDGVYLLENGFEALLHAEPGAPPSLMQALFGARHPTDHTSSAARDC